KAERIGARARGAWTFLRGEAPAIARLAQGVGFRYRYEPARDAFAHAAGFVGGALATALRDAGAGAEGPAASPLLLLCYHFDPRTGRYTLAILDLLRAAIAVFFAGIALWAWRQHRRRRAAREGGA